MDLDRPGAHHTLVREVFDLEKAWREGSERGSADEFENVYVAALLLFLIGDPSDVPRLYAAKFGTRDFDLAAGSDPQSIFGAGRDETLAWLLANGRTEEHAVLSEWLRAGEDPPIEEWAELKLGYYFSPEGELLLDPL